MSRKYEKRTKTYEETVLVEKRCDLCGVLGEPEDSWSPSGIYDVNETEVEVTVRQKEGSQYPDGGSGTQFVVDLCPTCFKYKLIPWLRSQGADLKQTDWDW